MKLLALALGLVLNTTATAVHAQDRLNYYSPDFGLNSAQAVPGTAFDRAVREGLPKTVVRFTTPAQQPKVETKKPPRMTVISTDGSNVVIQKGDQIKFEPLWPTR